MKRKKKVKKMLGKKHKIQKLKELKEKLVQLEKVKLPAALKKYGEVTRESSDSWHQSASFEIADEEVAITRSMIIELKKEILKLSQEIYD